MGDAWLPQFERIVPVLQPYLRAGHPVTDHSLAVGILAESLSQLGSAGSQYFSQVLPHALTHSSSEDGTCRQNSIFCLGVLGQYGGEPALGQMQTILEALQPHLAEEEEDMVKDNVVGALSRLVLAFGPTLPLDSILPAIISKLPLEADFGENTPALRCLMQSTHDERSRVLMGPLVGQLLSIIARLLGSSDADEALHGEMRSFVGWLCAQGPSQFEALVMTLKEIEREPIAACVRMPN